MASYNTDWFWTWTRNYGSYGSPTIYNFPITSAPTLSGWSYWSNEKLGYSAKNYTVTSSHDNYCYLRFAYNWDVSNPNNAKVKVRLELVQFQHYLLVNSHPSYINLGYNIVKYGDKPFDSNRISYILDNYPNLINIPNYHYVNAGAKTNSYYVNYSNGVVGGPYSGLVTNHSCGYKRRIANHVIVLEEQTATVPYNGEGIAQINVNYKLFLRYQIILSNGKVDTMNSSGTVSFKSPKRAVKLTGISIRATNSYNALKPKSISLTGLTNNATSYNLEVTETKSKSKTFGAKVNDYIPYTFEQSFSVSPSTNVEGTVSITSSNPNVLTINTPTVNISDKNNRKFKCTCKNPGTATITLSCNGKTAKQTFTVKSDNTFTWSSNNSKIVSVDNGKVTANAGYNGKVTITAKSKGNTSLTKNLTINSLLRPSSYSVIPDRYTMYPGETINFNIITNPMTSNDSKNVASQFRGVDCIIANNNATGGTIFVEDVLKEASNKSGNFNTSYKLTSTANTKNYIVCDVSPMVNDSEDWSYFLNLSTYLNIPIVEPTIKFSKSKLNISFNSTEKVNVITTPANGKFNLIYDKSFLEVTRDENTLKIKPLQAGNTTITATGNMTILSYMTQPTATLPITVTDTMLNSITTKNVNYDLDYDLIFIGNLELFEAKYEIKDDYIYEQFIHKESIVVKNNEVFNTDVFLKFKPYTGGKIKLNYAPKKSSDRLRIYSTNPDIVIVNDVDIDLENLNGSVEIPIICKKDGQATIIAQSLNRPSVIAEANVVVTANKSVTIKATEDKYVPKSGIKLIGEPEYNTKNGVYILHYSLKSGNYNGETSLWVNPTKNAYLQDRIGVDVQLVPNKLNFYIDKYNNTKVFSDKSNDRLCREISAFVKDELNLIMELFPNSKNEYDRQVNINHRDVNYKYYIDDKHTPINKDIINVRNNNQRNLTDEFKFTIPENIKADSYIIEADTDDKYDIDLKSNIKINIEQPSLYVKGYKGIDPIIIYLANVPNNSKKKLTINITPSKQKYITEPGISDKSSERGYTLSKDSKNNNVLIVNATGTRNLHKSGKNSKVTEKEAVYVNGKPNKNILGYDFKIKYDGYIQSGRTVPTANVKVYNLAYFKEPYVENTNYSINAMPELHYYGEKPKIILWLPNSNDFDILDNIKIKFYNSTEYSFKNNPELFSIYYNGNTKNHSIISSAIVDYKTLGNRHMCVFSPNKTVPNGTVTVTYESTQFSDTVPSASTKFSLVKKELPELPKIGDPIKLSDIQAYLNAITDVLGKGKYDVFGDTNIASLNFIGSNETNKESAILAMPFLKLLLILNHWLTVYNAFSTYTNGNSITTPQNLTFVPVRNMFVKRSSRDKWVKTKYEDEFFYETYKQLTGKEFLDDSFPDDDYPVMVDDSNDFVGDESFGIQNKFKSTQYYNEYTISPLVEIIKALKQL